MTNSDLNALASEKRAALHDYREFQGYMLVIIGEKIE